MITKALGVSFSTLNFPVEQDFKYIHCGMTPSYRTRLLLRRIKDIVQYYFNSLTVKYPSSKANPPSAPQRRQQGSYHGHRWQLTCNLLTI